MLMSGITPAWLLYEMAIGPPRSPRRTLAILQYGSLIGVVGSLVMRASEK
jgi:hypothetical protein